MRTHPQQSKRTPQRIILKEQQQKEKSKNPPTKSNQNNQTKTMPTALGNTARILRNLRLHAYKRTLIAFFLVEIVITFLFTVTVSGRNGLHSSPNLPPSPSDVHQNHRYSSSSSSSTEAPPTPDGLFPLSFFSESVSILNLPLNLVGMVLVSTEAVYFTLLYFPLRYFFTVALFRLVAAAPFAYCYPLMIDLLLVVVLHFYYVRLYNVKFFGGGRRSRGGGDGDDQEFVIEEETDNDSIFSVENHLHAAQLNAPPPSYTEVARNPLKYPSLVGVVEVGNSGGNASSSSAVLQLAPRRLESIEEVGEEAASAAAAAAAVEGQMTSTTLASTTTATTTNRT